MARQQHHYRGPHSQRGYVPHTIQHQPGIWLGHVRQAVGLSMYTKFEILRKDGGSATDSGASVRVRLFAGDKGEPDIAEWVALTRKMTKEDVIATVRVKAMSRNVQESFMDSLAQGQVYDLVTVPTAAEVALRNFQVKAATLRELRQQERDGVTKAAAKANRLAGELDAVHDTIYP